MGRIKLSLPNQTFPKGPQNSPSGQPKGGEPRNLQRPPPKGFNTLSNLIGKEILKFRPSKSKMKLKLALLKGPLPLGNGRTPLNGFPNI